jgi:ATP-binding cassette, subfamily B, bacterial
VLDTIIFTVNKVKKSSNFIFYSFLFLSIFYSILSFGTTLIFKEIVDTASGTRTFLHLSIWGVLLFKVGFDIFCGIVNGVREYLLPIIKRNSSLLFLSELVDKTSKLDVASLEDPKTVGIISRAYSRIHFQFEFYFKNIVQLLTTTIEIALALVIFYAVSPLGALILLIANLINTIIKAILGGTNFNIYKADYETRLKFGYATDLLNQRETLLELKLFQNFNYLKTKILNIYNTFITKEINHEKRNQIISNFVDLVPIGASFTFTIILANQLQARVITVGTFVFLFTNMLIFAGALGRFRSTMVGIATESNSIKDILEFYKLESKVTEKVITDKTQLEDISNKIKNPNIEFLDVSFKYPNSETCALKNISLKIPYSQNLALIGENGAGKTTLIKLLLRVYDPTEGKILINGIDIKEIPTDLLYKCFGTLFQNFGKFNLTVRENLELAANKKISDEEMIQCLKYSNAWKFIELTKGKLDQQLGPEYENGIDLSGGQWQSLAIARTYAKEAPIVILDEPTSAIDVKSEMEIFDRLNKKMKDETLIFISHRFSTIKDAEKIVVLHQGKIVEEGNHASLMKINGRYANLYNIQVERLKRI